MDARAGRDGNPDSDIADVCDEDLIRESVQAIGGKFFILALDTQISQKTHWKRHMHYTLTNSNVSLIVGE